MSERKFITELEVSKVGLWGHGVLTDIYPTLEKVDIPTHAEIRKISETVLSAKLRKVSTSIETAVADAAAAREIVEKFVETARETFRDVIAELLAPHYRYLEEHLGIKPPEFENEAEKPSSKLKERSFSARNTSKQASGGSPHSKGTEDAEEDESASKTKRRASQVARKKAKAPQEKRVTLPKKKATATSSAKSKGAKPCRKK